MLKDNSSELITSQTNCSYTTGVWSHTKYAGSTSCVDTINTLAIQETKTLKELFPNEATDFTPWLTNQDIIETILYHLENKDFAFWKREVKIGDYRVDMIYQSHDKSISYIIENQYGTSDNKHFGQIVVYRYLTRIPNILWICDEVTLEHKNVIKDVKDFNCIPCSVEIKYINSFNKKDKHYKMLFKTYSKKYDSKIFVFKVSNDLKHVSLEEII